MENKDYILKVRSFFNIDGQSLYKQDGRKHDLYNRKDIHKQEEKIEMSERYIFMDIGNFLAI